MAQPKQRIKATFPPNEAWERVQEFMVVLWNYAWTAILIVPLTKSAERALMYQIYILNTKILFISIY